MKRKFEHPPGVNANGAAEELSGPKYWRSLDELAKTPGFQAQMEREFPDGASNLEGVDRRHFMKIMAASFALGGVGLAGCRRPEKFILPYGKSVEGVIPGLPSYYATAMPLRRWAIPLLAETHQGRPTKLEGNPTYEPHGGAASLLAQASVLDLYDPDRANGHTKGGKALNRNEVEQLLASIGQNHAGSGGEGLAFLAEESSSPTRRRMIGALRAKLPRAIWAEYEPVADEPPVAAAQAAFGSPVRPLYNFAKAARIVSIDADFLQTEAGSLYYARGFSNGRRVAKKDDPMNRLYMAESALTITGMMADHRLRLASSHMLAFAARLAATVNGELGAAAKGAVEGVDIPQKWIDECAADLTAHRGKSVVVAGAHLPVEVHALVHAINSAIGAIGETVNFLPVESAQGVSNILGLANAIKGGSVKTLVVLGGNPAYNAPADLDWPALQKSVPEVIRVGYYVDETSSVNSGATTHIARAHYLESWGDARAIDGTVLPIQPMILPLFGGLTDIEVLARIAGEKEADPYALVAATITGLAGADANADQTMARFLHDGVLKDSAAKPAQVQFNSGRLGELLGAAKAPATFSQNNLEVRFVTDFKVDDGRYANNGWLQECPHPVTKISWDNAILVSPKLAHELGIEPHGSLIQVARKEEAEYTMGKEKAPVFELSIGGRKVTGPVHIQPGLANYTVVVSLGYGRSVVGHVGKGAGFNAYPLRTNDTPHIATGGKLAPTGRRALLANTQEHWSMEGRDIIREANFEGANSYQEDPAYVRKIGMESHSPSILGEYGEKMTPQERATKIPRGNSLYQTPAIDRGAPVTPADIASRFDEVHQWGMSIDMNTCIGCQACVVACQAENNVPIVGKEQVLRGREMHWLRIDRYYSDGSLDPEAFGGAGNRAVPEDPQISVQPMMCVHCELAPCETVCPVNATVHDDEGLNTMAYNRCIGTRYCANNCPYKVRRFNFFDWNQRRLDELYLSQLADYGMPELVAMGKNPEVTVRIRGVMEKCTYCVQRIQNGKIQHKVKVMQAKGGAAVSLEEIRVPDRAIKTACEQTCPVDAIVFGNILDEKSDVMKAKAREQDYAVLGYLNTRPRTTYSGKLRNPNPKMPGYNPLPASRVEYEKKNVPQGHGEAHGGDHAAHGASEAHGAPAHAEPNAQAEKKGAH